jgi:tight adherence protein B
VIGPPAVIATVCASASAFTAGCLVEARRHDAVVGQLLPTTTDGERGGSLADRLRTPEALRIGAAVGGTLFGVALAGPPGAALGLGAGLAVPVWSRRRRSARDAAALVDQLPDAVSNMSAGMRAGLSLSRSIGFAADEAMPPLGSVLRELVDRERLGVPLGLSLEGWTQPDNPRDLRLFGGILQLHRRTGGDLPRVLDQLAATLRDRADAARELRGYTAQARLSGGILGGLPIGFFLFLSLTSRNDIAAAYRTPIGAGAIALGLVLEAAAFLWIRSLLRVDL